LTPHTITASYAANDGIHLNSNGSTALTVTQRQGIVAYIGQTVFFSSGSSSTSAQVALSASVADPSLTDPSVLSNATVTFTDLLQNKVLASGVKVTPVANSDTATGTANTIVTLSTGNYGAQEYLIEVTLDGTIYSNSQQTSSPPGSSPYEAAHAKVMVMIPPTTNSTQGGAIITKLSTAAGTYGDANGASYTFGMKYNKGGSNPQGQVQLILPRSDGTYYVKSNSITSLAFGPANGTQPPKDVTIYTKASVYKVVGSTLVSVDGNVTLRVDAHEGCTTSPNCSASNGDTVGFTVLSSKTGNLYYSNNWVFDSPTLSYKTVPQSVSNTGGTAVVIN